MTIERRLAAAVRGSPLAGSVVHRRWATVDAVNLSPPTVDIDLAGTPIPGVAYLGMSPAVGDLVVVDITEAGSPLVLGSTAEDASGWLAYSPTVKFGATAITLGNGSLSGLWIVEGKLVHFEVALSWGSTSSTNGGTGALTASLPATVAQLGNNVGAAIGQAEIIQAGVARTARFAVATTAGTEFFLGDMAFGQGSVTEAAPFTFAQTANGFVANGAYRIA